MLDAFRQVLKRAAPPPVHEVTPERLTVRECIDAILARLRDTGQTSFESLFPEGATRHRIIVTFLALLELIRHHHVSVEQAELFGEIWVLPPVEEAVAKAA